MKLAETERLTSALKGERGELDAWLEVNNEAEVRLHVEAYARASVAHATAARDAEIEALRNERDFLVEEYERAVGCGPQGYTHAAMHLFNAITNAQARAQGDGRWWYAHRNRLLPR